MDLEDRIFKIIDNKYEINEYIYVIKEIKRTFIVFIMDFERNSFYIEDNYPLELVRKGIKREIAKKDFYLKYKEKIEENIKDDFNEYYMNIISFKIQKSLF